MHIEIPAVFIRLVTLSERNLLMGIEEILNALVAVQGIEAAVCVGRDGFVIEAAAAAGADVDAIGAMVATGLGSAESVGRELNVGGLSQAMMEYDQGVIVMTAIGNDAILAVVAATSASLGNVRLQVRKRRTELEAAL